MVTTQLREELHQLINSANDEVVLLMYTFMKAETDADATLTEEQERQLRLTIRQHKAGLSKSYTWAEARAEIEKRR